MYKSGSGQHVYRSKQVSDVLTVQHGRVLLRSKAHDVKSVTTLHVNHGTGGGA